MSLGDLPGSETFQSAALGTRPAPLGRSTASAIGADRVYVGTADSFSVLVFSLTGEPLAPLRYDDVDLRTTPDDIERYKALDTAGLSENERTLRVLNWANVQFPPMIPAYDAMLVDASDMLWVRRMPRRIGGEAEWIVFSPDGAPTARLTLPGDLTVYEIGDAYIAGVRTAAGGQVVEVHSLRRTP